MPRPSPYRKRSTNTLYNLLFCDDIGLIAKPKDVASDGMWALVRKARPSSAELIAIATEPANDARLRGFAYHRLRGLGEPVDRKDLLGVIVEVHLDVGLDVLAAYCDGTARYLNHSESTVIWETETADVSAAIKNLLEASRFAITQLGPWTKGRRPPPTRGSVRLSFIASDGLYFGEGTFQAMLQDQIGGAVLQSAQELMLMLGQKALDRTP